MKKNTTQIIAEIHQMYPNGFKIHHQKIFKWHLIYTAFNYEDSEHCIELWNAQNKWYLKLRLNLIEGLNYCISFNSFEDALRLFKRIMGTDVVYYDIVKLNSKNVL